MHVKTGDVRNAGTDANVFLKIFGSKGDTDSIKLRSSDTSFNKFEKGRTDLFKLETTDIGKVRIVWSCQTDAVLACPRLFLYVDSVLLCSQA